MAELKNSRRRERQKNIKVDMGWSGGGRGLNLTTPCPLFSVLQLVDLAIGVWSWTGTASLAGAYGLTSSQVLSQAGVASGTIVSAYGAGQAANQAMALNAQIQSQYQQMQNNYDAITEYQGGVQADREALETAEWIAWACHMRNVIPECPCK